MTLFKKTLWVATRVVIDKCQASQFVVKNSISPKSFTKLKVSAQTFKCSLQYPALKLDEKWITVIKKRGKKEISIKQLLSNLKKNLCFIESILEKEDKNFLRNQMR